MAHTYSVCAIVPLKDFLVVMEEKWILCVTVSATVDYLLEKTVLVS